MPVLSNPAFGPRTALGYVTVGSLMCVWTGVWYWTRETDLTRSQWFWVAGFFLTGATLVLLGMLLGPLGRAARRAELPPSEALNAEAAIQQTAAANPPAVAATPPTLDVAPQIAANAARPAGVVPTVAAPAAAAPAAPPRAVPAQ